MLKKTIFMGIIAGSILLTLIGVLNAQQVVASNNGKNPDPENEQRHSKDCDGDGNDGDCVSNTHKHRMNCDEDGNCDANSGSVVNTDDSHYNQNCNSHRNDAATGGSPDCKDNGELPSNN